MQGEALSLKEKQARGPKGGGHRVGQAQVDAQEKGHRVRTPQGFLSEHGREGGPVSRVETSCVLCVPPKSPGYPDPTLGN